MWLMEFLDGENRGLILPIETEIYLKNDPESIDNNTLVLSDYSKVKINLEIKNINDAIYLIGLKKKERIKLKENKIYNIGSVRFFIYKEGRRNPKINLFYINRYASIAILFIFINITLLFVIFYFLQGAKNKYTLNYFESLDSAYIKNGKLYVFDELIYNNSPADLKNNVIMINNNYNKVENLSIDVITKNNNKLKYTVIDNDDYSKIVIDYPEKEMEIMKCFGEMGVAFKHINKTWIVNDIVIAKNALKKAGYPNEILKLDVGDGKYIDKDNFPFAIFFSNQGESYIYDTQNRYWEGTVVPNLGVLESITNERIIFRKNSINYIYAIHK